MKDQKQVPTKDNDIFDHSADSVADATGVGKDELQTALITDEEMHEKILDACGGLESGSLAVEALFTRLTKKQLAAMLFASLKKQLTEDPIQELMLMMRAAKRSSDRKKAEAQKN